MNVNQPRTPATDSRALQNLLKSEKSYGEHLLTATSASLSAASSLAAWGISETPDLDHAAQDVAHWLEESARGQRMLVVAIDGYRAALKDILDREHNIANIVRDRDILLSRVLKESTRRPTRRELTTFDDEHQARFADAQRELAACEQVLAHETAALIGVKRRTFKEALTMRCKCMGEAGAIMMDAAREIITRLDAFDANVPVTHMDVHTAAPLPPGVEPTPQGGYESEEEAQALSVSHVSTDVRKQPLPPTPNNHRRSNSDTFSNIAGIGAGVLFRSPVGRSSSAAGGRTTPSANGRYTPMSTAGLPVVAGGVPSAPRLDTDAIASGFVPPPVAGNVPSAPGTVLRRERGTTEASDDEAPRRGGSGWQMRNHRGAPSEDGTTVVDYRHGHRSGGGGGGGGSFLSKMSHLFRSDMRSAVGGGHSSYESRPRHGRSSSVNDFARVRDDVSDDEPVNVVRHVNENPGFALRHAELPDDEITEAARRSVIGAGISSPQSERQGKPPSRPASRQGKPPSRPASRQGKTPNRPASRQGKPPSRPSSRQSVRAPSVAASVDLPPPSLGPIPRGYSSQNLKEAANLSDVPTAPPLDRLVGEVQQPVRRKVRGSAGPPPAPSSFYQGFTNNPAKYATDSWVAKADATPNSRADSDAGSVRRKKTASSPSKKSKRLSAEASPMHKSEGPMSLSIDTRFDGTGHIDLDLQDYKEARASGSPVKPVRTSGLPSMTALAPVARTAESESTGAPESSAKEALSPEVESSQPLLSADDEAAYRAFLAHPNAISRMSSGSVLSGVNTPRRTSEAIPLQKAPPLAFLGAAVEKNAAGDDPSPSAASPYCASVFVPTSVSSPAISSTLAAPASSSTSAAPTPAAQTNTGEDHQTERSPAPALPSSMANVSSTATKTRKNVRINSETETAPEPKSAADELDDAPGGRPRRTWSTRIGSSGADDSSDDGTGQGDDDTNDYQSARKAFGSATRHLGVATGSAPPKTRPPKAPRNRPSASGYNPSVHLPAGLETVARSR
ncbi:hypothetical protein MCUN1_003509 [Malassezia cuniculi]|uniref:Eisosome component PIL1-domain-containing protein n=1 Tax=Malassezia cuniculi TaxID=948313 RepID=A0AAF0EWV8_9BASI|nr:hypothetical protein MCUN1_003509 [Malassezia cuniculi]